MENLTLLGLVPGVEYVATVYSVGFDARSYARAGTFSVGSDRMTVNQDEFDNNGGIRISHRYVADASGSVTIGIAASDAASTLHLYGISNYELASTNAPVVYRQPRAAQWVGAGTDVTLHGFTGGVGPLFYQWRRNGVDLDGATNANLTLAAVTTAEAGTYTLVVSNTLGTVVSSNSVVEVGLPVVNPSFEADAFTVTPGYVGTNFPITGWTSASNQVGINPLSYAGVANNPASSPFANNGTIPDGKQAAFMQANCTLNQVIDGFTPGNWYYVKFYENARSGQPAPSLSVTLGGEEVVASHVVATGDYRVVASELMMATAESMTLTFVKNGGDSVLLDAVGVLEAPLTPPEFAAQPLPAEAWFVAGESLHRTAVAIGATPLLFQWQRDGADLPGETNSTLDVVSLDLGQSGAYRMIASNAYGQATSQVSVVRVGLAFSELFNTGIDATGAFTPGGSADVHYRLTYSADPSYPGPAAIVMDDAYPIDATRYMTNGPASKWIAPMLNTLGYGGNLPGLYVYRTAFLLDTVDPASARIEGRWAMDNVGAEIRVNGVSAGVGAAAGYTAWASFVLTNGFVAGSNIIEFVISNAPPTGPTGFRAELRGVGLPRGAGLPQVLDEPDGLLVQDQGAASFEVVAAGSAPLTYQWFRDGAPLDGATNRLLSIPVAGKPDEGGYRVIVANGSGPVTSAVAALAVNLPPVGVADARAALMDHAVALPASGFAANDSDPDGDPLGLTAVGAMSTNGGSVALAGGVVTFTPAAGFAGDDLFRYTVGDGRGGFATTDVAVVVGPAATVGGQMRTLSSAPGGLLRFGFAGVPSCPYTIEGSTNLLAPWFFVTNLVASPAGLLQWDEEAAPAAPRQRFLRTVYP